MVTGRCPRRGYRGYARPGKFAAYARQGCADFSGAAEGLRSPRYSPSQRLSTIQASSCCRLMVHVAPAGSRNRGCSNIAGSVLRYEARYVYGTLRELRAVARTVNAVGQHIYVPTYMLPRGATVLANANSREGMAYAGSSRSSGVQRDVQRAQTRGRRRARTACVESRAFCPRRSTIRVRALPTLVRR